MNSTEIPQKNMVFKIPIGVEFEWFNTKTRESQTMARTHLGIPQSAFVIGSFQKDGNGWNEGYCPKLIKGPDIFLKTLDILRHRISDLFVLLTGPARGYVRKGLEAMNIPYKHDNRLVRGLDYYSHTTFEITSSTLGSLR